MSLPTSDPSGNPPAVILATDDERALLGDGVDLETLAAFEIYCRKANAITIAVGDAFAALGQVIRAANLDLDQAQSLAARLSVRLDCLIASADVDVLGTFGGEDR